MPEITLEVIEFDPDHPEIEAGHLALDNTTSPPSVRMSADDVALIPTDSTGTLQVTVAYFYIRSEKNDESAQSQLAAGFKNSFKGKRQRVINDQSIVFQIDADALAAAELAKELLGQHDINFKVRSTHDDYRPGQQLQIIIPTAKPVINLLFTISDVGTEFKGIDNGRDSMLHSCKAVLVQKKSLAQKMSNSLQKGSKPQLRAPIQIVPPEETEE